MITNRSKGKGMRAYQVLVFLLLMASHNGASAQRPSPAPPQTRSFLIKAAVLHVGDGTTIDDAAVGFRNGVIDYVGHSYGVKAAYDSVIDAKGAHLYPGLILPDNTLGLHEIDLARATDDEDELGDLEPSTRAITAYNSDSKLIPTVRANGVLLAQVTPRGGTISGSSSIVQLDAWDTQSAAVVPDDGIHLNWPGAFQREGWWAEPGSTSNKQDDERAKRIDAIRQFFLKAQAYAAAPTHAATDQRMEAMRGLFSGTGTLFVHAERAREIQEAVMMAHELGVKRTVIVGGYDAWRVADLLHDKKVDVVLGRLHALPMRDDDDIDLPFRLPSLLKEKGIRFCLGYEGDMERMGARNLAFTAGTAAFFGLGKEAALQAMTLDAARVLGIDKRYGSLEPGKSATLFVSTGDALDMRTCAVTHAFIDGRHLDLDDHQRKLWRQYEQRYAR